MGNKATCKFLSNNANDVIDYFKSLGYKWTDYIDAHGAISKAWFTLKQGDGSLIKLDYGDYIVYDYESKQFSKLPKEEYENRKYEWTFIGHNSIGKSK